MKSRFTVAEVFSTTLRNQSPGIVGIVDNLLAACVQHQLELEWQGSRCRVRSADGDWEELPKVPLRKSGFRAILARLAALCNEQTPNSASPYGAECELIVGSDPQSIIRLAFTNTADEQRLELTTSRPDKHSVVQDTADRAIKSPT